MLAARQSNFSKVLAVRKTNSVIVRAREIEHSARKDHSIPLTESEIMKEANVLSKPRTLPFRILLLNFVRPLSKEEHLLRVIILDEENKRDSSFKS